jgi:hypothetical protein
MDSDWTVYSGSVYMNDFGGWGGGEESRVLTQDDSMLIADTTLVNVDAPGHFFEDVSNNKVYVWCQGSANPNNCLMVIGTSNRCAVEYLSNNANWIKFFGLRLTHGSGWIVHTDASSCDSNTYSNCTMAYWGGYSGGNLGAWTSEQSTVDSTIYAQHNLIQACSLFCGMSEKGRILAHTVATYAQHRVIIDSCVLHSSGNGVYFKDQSGKPQHYGNTVKHSTIYNMEQSGVQWTSHHQRDSVWGNTIYNCARGIWEGGSYQGPLNGESYICNNTIYHCYDVGISFFDGAENDFNFLGRNNQVKFNIIYACSTSGDEEVIGFAYCEDSTQSLFGVIDSNLYYANTHSTTEGHRNRIAGNEQWTWESWIDTNRYGFDQHSTCNAADPEFNNPSAGDFSRPDTCQEMNVTYGGRTWYLYGAWQPDEPPEFLCGDVTDDCFVDIDDIQFLIAYVFSGGPAPDPMESGDVNCSGDPSVDLDDIVYLITYVFQGGPAPCAGC